MKPQIEKLDSITVTDSSPHHFKEDSVGYISISPSVGFGGNSPVDSPSGSHSHTGENACGGHISLVESPVNSPALSSLESEYTPVANYNRVLSLDDETHRSPVAVDNPVVVFAAQESKAVVLTTDQGDGGGSGVSRFKPSFPILRRDERDEILKKAALGFRISGFIFSLVSFSVLAADRYKGWALDSFNRYIEFRYCLSMNVIGLLYSGAQAFDLSYHLATGKFLLRHHLPLRRILDFAFDQVIAYLLISASSSAAIRVEDWEVNWGKDKFPDMATASVTLSFLAFVAVACSSLISGYALCTSKSL